MKIKIFFAISVVLTALTTIFYMSYTRKDDVGKDINCFAQVRYDYDFDYGNAVMKAGILFALSNGRGVISYGGKFYHKGNVYTVKRYAEVSYSEKNDHAFLLKTTSLRVSLIDNLPEDLARKYLYSYLWDKDGWMSVGIQPNADNGYIMSTNTIPQLLCKQIG